MKEYPELKVKIETMPALSRTGWGYREVPKPRDGIIEELRQMGNEVLHGWVRRQQEKKNRTDNANPGGN